MSLIWGITDTYKKYPSFLVITIILAISILLLEIYYPRLRGFMGEFWVKRELKKLPKKKYKVINNVMIKDERGTHQTDHIVLCSFGIFVIEMKNYYGKIYGKEFDSKWTQYTKKEKHILIILFIKTMVI